VIRSGVWYIERVVVLSKFYSRHQDLRVASFSLCRLFVFKLDQYQEILMSISTPKSKSKTIALARPVGEDACLAKCARNSLKIGVEGS
jgi:hypothetical protein